MTWPRRLGRRSRDEDRGNAVLVRLIALPLIEPTSSLAVGATRRTSYTYAVTTALPKVLPLVLKRRAAAFDNPHYLYELKHDGFRALLEIDNLEQRSGAHIANRGLVVASEDRFKACPPASQLSSEAHCRLN